MCDACDKPHEVKLKRYNVPGRMRAMDRKHVDGPGVIGVFI